MSADWKPPGLFRYIFIEWKARQFHDPIKKLAYLRRAANTSLLKPQLHISGYLKIALLLLLVFFASRIHTIKDVNADYAREKHVSKTPDIRYNPNTPGSVWLVENGRDYEVYSNGLRLEKRFLTPNEPRSYVVFRHGTSPLTYGDRRSNPAGIVFHTSESQQAPLVSDKNATLTRIGAGLLHYVSQQRAYHFVIDRFGRVFRVVPETDIANHAGYSVWADPYGIYINLNHSFLGVSFEAQTRDIDQGYYLSPAQINSGRLLVEMLVSKYRIPLGNCVTHAQVSVDPNSMTIGHHTDGSGDFPFLEMGIPDNYSLPVPSLFVFGFDFDSRFLMSTGTRMWKGVLLADERLRREANSQHLSVAQYKPILREKYRTSIETLKSLGVIKEN